MTSFPVRPRSAGRTRASPDAQPGVAEGTGPGGVRVIRFADGLLDAALVLLATWTAVYDVALLGRGSATAAVAVEGVVLAALVLGVLARSRRRGRHRAGHRTRPTPVSVGRPARRPVGRVTPVVERSLLAVVLVAAVVASTAMAASWPWWMVWIPWLVAGLLATTVAFAGRPGLDVRRQGALLDQHHPPEGVIGTATRAEIATVLVWAVGLAVVSTITLRPNPDDLFYVNLSQWVAAHGTFPLRDTLFSDLRYPAVNFPPVASYDGLVGAIAHVLGLPAGDVVYLVVPPVATFLSVLALWRLLRTWRVPHVALAVWIAMAFLLFDGTSSYGSPGNLFVTRLWQGKVILLCVVVPTLLAHLSRYVERPTRRRACWLFLGGVAGTALSTTAIFLLPLVALAGVAPLARRKPRVALLGLAATAAYPLVAGVVTIAVGGRSADDFGVRRLYRFDPEWFGHEVFLTGLVALIGVGAALLGHLAIPHRPARLTTSVLVVLVGITLVPGVTRLGYDLVGIGPTLWRVTWGLTLGALVGTAGAHLLTTPILNRLPRWLAPIAGVLALALLVVLGHPIWAPETSTSLVAPPHWQRGAETRAVVARMLRETAPGAVVLVPEGLGVTVALTTTDLKTVAPRTYAMAGLRQVPSFDYAQRLLLQDLVNVGTSPSPSRTRAALAALHVSIACTFRDDDGARRTLRRAGYRSAWGTTTYTCLKPSVHP